MSATETTTPKKTNGSTPVAAAAAASTDKIAAGAKPAKRGKPSKEEREKLLAAMTPEQRAEAEAEAAKKSRKVYIVVGTVLEFGNAAAAEKFLNQDASAPKDFTVIKGSKIEKKQKTSLR